MKNIKVLSLFDGLSGARIALNRAGIKVDKYYSSEINEHAIIIANDNYPQDEEFRLGDINNWRNWEIDKPDLIIAGFPCQSWSLAGNQLGHRDERGDLVHTLIEIYINTTNLNISYLRM